MAPRRRREARVVGPGRPPAEMQAVCLQEVIRQPRARQRAACRGPVLLPGGRAEASSRHLEPAWPSGPGLCLELAPLQPAERRDGRSAWCQALASRTVPVWLSGQQASPGELPAQRVSERALPLGLASPSGEVGPQGPLTEAQPRAAEAPAGWQDVRVPRSAGEAVSVRVVVEPRPEAASVLWAQQAAAGAAEAPDASRAAGLVEAAALGAPARQPAGVLRADAAVQPSAAVRSGVREPRAAEAALPGVRRAAELLALPSEAASVFRQGPILAGPVQARSAVRLAHAMRSLRIASRSESSWRAARNVGWSWW